MKKETLKKTNCFLGLFFLFMLISYGVTSYSSTLTYSTVCGNLDSYCYRYMGMIMARGGVPYRDAFDNKGPLLYLINCIGYKISKKYGVFIIEYVFMMAYLMVQYSIARRFADVKRSIIYTVSALGPIGAFLIGNMTEEYALVFISIGLLVFIDYFLFDKKNWYRIVICGIACGAVLMLRPNMVVVWAVFCIYAVIISIRDNKTFPLKTMLQFTGGVLIAVIPFVIWLFANDAIVDFWKDYYITNIMYSSAENSLANILNSFSSYIFASLSEVYFLLMLILIIKKQNLGFNIAYMIFMFLNCLVISLPGLGFEHYGMVVVPTLIYPLSSFARFIKKQLKTKSYFYDIFAVLSSVLLISFIINNYYVTIRALASGNPTESRNERIVSAIMDNTDPEDRILVFGFKDYYYVESDRLCASKYHFFISENDIYPDGMDVVIEDINNCSPKLIVIEQGFNGDYLNFDFSDYSLLDDDLNIWIRNI